MIRRLCLDVPPSRGKISLRSVTGTCSNATCASRDQEKVTNAKWSFALIARARLAFLARTKTAQIETAPVG